MRFVVPKLSWGADGSWGCWNRAQGQRLRKFCGKKDQLVHLRLHETVAMVPLLREAHDILQRVTALDLDSCLAGLEYAEVGDSTIDVALAARKCQIETEIASLPNVKPFYVFTGGTLSLNMLLSTINSCRSLTSLCLSNNGLSARDMPALCSILFPLLCSRSEQVDAQLQHGRSRERPDTSSKSRPGGAIEERGGEVAERLRAGTLTSLDLSYNGFGDAGLEELCRVFGEAANATGAVELQSFDLRGNSIGPGEGCARGAVGRGREAGCMSAVRVR